MSNKKQNSNRVQPLNEGLNVVKIKNLQNKKKKAMNNNTEKEK